MICIDGFLTGMLLQISLGPVFLFVAQASVQHGLLNGLASVLAVVLVDGVYISLAAAGLGEVLKRPNVQPWFAVGSGLVLLLFGASFFISGIRALESVGAVNVVEVGVSPFQSFTAGFLLTASSPLTIVFWTGVLAAKASEKNYSGKELVVFSGGAIASTAVFLGAAVCLISALKRSIPVEVIPWLNIAVAMLIIVYAFRGLLGPIRKKVRR